jgi:DNA-binding transcriptional LysR family regulator
MRHIKGKDLNLLPVFAALWRERNVTKAAQALGMTQPALSRALSRLRSEFGDPLFVRSSKGVSPTARASEMASEIISIVDHLDHLYEPSGKFDPARLERVFTIVTTDYFESAAAERLIPKILREAPHASLNFRTNFGGIPRESLEKGDVDLAILGVFERIPEGFYTQKILTDTYRSVVRSTHPAKRFTVEQFTQYPHILMTPKGDMYGIVDESLERLGKARHIAVGSSNFLSAGWAVANSDLILTAPGLVIDQMAERLSLTEFQTPVETPQLDIFQIWHARTHNDPAQKWLRALIAGSF